MRRDASLPATKVSGLTFPDSAWHEAWDKNHNAVMTSLNIAKAGDSSNEFLDYLQEQEFIDSILKA